MEPAPLQRIDNLAHMSWLVVSDNLPPTGMQLGAPAPNIIL